MNVRGKKNHFHFHFLALLHPHLQILVSSFTRCGFLFAADGYFNAPAFLALDSIVVSCVKFLILSSSSASQECIDDTYDQIRIFQF